MSLRLRLFLSHAAVILIGLVVLFLALLVLLRQVEMRRVQRELSRTAIAVARIGRPLLQSVNPQRQLERLTRGANAEQRARILLLDANSQVIADSAPAQVSLVGQRLDLDVTQPGAVIAEDVSIGEFRDLQSQRFTYAAVATPVSIRSDIEWFVLAQPAAGPFMGVLDDLALPMVQALIIALTTSALVAAFVARSIAKPIQRVATGARALAQGNYGERVAMSGPTEIKQLAADFNDMATRVQQAQQTERDFVANVSHELRTPLTSIQGFAQAIRDGDVSDDESTRNAARIIHEEADRLRRLTSELLDSARLESGDMRLAHETVRVNELVEGCIAKMQPRANSSGVALAVQLTNDLPVITADGDYLAQVITNLIDNALKHTASDGKITVETRLAQHKVQARGDTQPALPEQAGIEISVADNGSGIPPEDLPHIFDRFYQADKSRSMGGSGLGLSISKQIVEAQRGRIDVQSVAGLGTRVSVWMPVGKDPKNF